MKTIILHISIFITFYILGAYATTDILRLLKGAVTPVNAPDCYCPVCSSRIALRDQLPIFSYLKNHGTCRNCKSHIPFSNLFLELFLFLLLSGIAAAFHFSAFAWGLCVLSYEAAKLAFLLRFGKREVEFRKNLMISLAYNLLFFTVLGFLFALTHIA